MGTQLNLTGYKLTFDDEFNSYDLNNGGTQSGTWNTYFTGFNVRTLSGNGEQEYYSDPSVGVNPFSVQNGELTITAAPGSNPAGLPYNSGTINTEGVFSQAYGYFEMRAELPQGQGMWPAFWMLPASNGWPPELDALEAFGAPNSRGEGGSNQYHVAEISTNSSQNNGSWETVPANIYTSYNTYGVMWTPQNVTYYFDGQEVAQFTTPSDMNQAMYLIANLAVGGNWPEAPAGETGQLKIDYIRAFSNSASATTVNLQPISSPDGNNAAEMADFTSGASAANVAPAPISGGTYGSGSHALVLDLSEDQYLGDAQAQVTIDGQTVGTYAVTALHSAGQDEAFTFLGNWAAGNHTIGVTFLNDAYGGSPTLDRNLYVDSASFDGTALSNVAQALYWTGATDSFAFNVPAPAPAPPPAPAPISGGTYGSGSHALVLDLSEDQYLGDAQAQVTIDGQTVGTYAVTALHSTGHDEAFTFLGNWAVGNHTIGVTFLNDAYGGSPALDRNLYVDSASFDGTALSNVAQALYWTGATDNFSFTVPSTTTTTTATSGSSSTVAEATPSVPRSYIAPDSTGIATGTSGADDIFATGSGQTLIGNGGDDIFEIGTHTDTHIVAGTNGITEVSTWASSYTLASGVNNLWLGGTYNHTATGNGMNNYIYGSNGNDTIDGGGGNVTIQVGTGANTLTGGGQHDTFVFNQIADHDNVIKDFHAAQDLLDLRGLMKDAGYTGSDPFADHVLAFQQMGANTAVIIDPTASTAHTMVTLYNVVASSLISGTNYLWR